MAFQKFPEQDLLSDLVAHWATHPYDSYTHRILNVTTTDNLPMGTVVFRAFDAVDQETPYAPVTAANATTAFAAGNEFGIVWGDKFKAQTLVEADASGTTKCMSFTKGDIQLKDVLIMKATGITSRTSAEYKAMKTLFENQQGIILVPMLDTVPYGL